jgi:polyhydroxyalkanoate synthesis regulator phasin
MITSFEIITFDKVYEIFEIVTTIFQIGFQTTVFIIKELFLEAFTHITIEKIVYICIIYNLLILIGMDNYHKKFTEQKRHINSLEKQILYLNKSEKMRENFNESFDKEFRAYYEYTTNKINAMERKIKKLEKDLKIYE